MTPDGCASLFAGNCVHHNTSAGKTSPISFYFSTQLVISWSLTTLALLMLYMIAITCQLVVPRRNGRPNASCIPSVHIHPPHGHTIYAPKRQRPRWKTPSSYKTREREQNKNKWGGAADWIIKNLCNGSTGKVCCGTAFLMISQPLWT